MKPSIVYCAIGLVSVLLPASMGQAAELNVIPTVPLVTAAPGNSVLVDAVILNETTQVVFLTDVSSDVGEAFATDNLFDEFLAVRPDSLLPGESWEGPLVRLTLAPDAPVSSTQAVTVYFSGGDHPADIQSLAAFTFALNDPAIVTGVPEAPPAAPVGILQAAPNPTRGSAELSFTLVEPGPVVIRVFDVQGRMVRTLLDEARDAGRQTVFWDGRDDGGDQVHAGIYFLRMLSREGIRKTKVVRIQ